MPRSRLHLVAAAFVAASPLAAQTFKLAPQSFTLEQIMSAPFSSDLTASRSANAVAWITIVKGARNVWVATGPSWQARQVTHYPDDDGQEITNLALSNDGRRIVYVRGGETNRSGERPNPALIAGGVDQSIWMVSLDVDAAPAKIAEGADPRLSPSGDSLAYEHGGQLWVARLGDSTSARQLTKLRGGPSTLRWSPDGKRLAFVSNRQRHSFVGVWDFTTRSLRYLDPTTDQDGSPVWSPDGKSIAFIRQPSRISDLIFLPERESPIPWSIRIADASTGQGRELWRASKGPGSVYRDVVSEDQLFWSAAGDRIAFAWEKDGWTHLYSVRSDTGVSASATLLTPGAFEVEYVNPSTDGRSLVYNSNQDDVDRRHIWRVPIDGSSKPVAVTSGTGLEFNPVSIGDRVAVIRADVELPARAAIVNGNSLRDLAPQLIPADFPAAQLVPPQPVILHAADGTVVHAQLFVPPHAVPGERHPAAIFFHGGSRRQMLLGWHYMYYYSNAYAMNQYLANHGFDVLSVNYRSGIGYGLNFREALRYGAAGGSEYGDVVAAGKFMRARSDVDPKRVALWGGSYGGYLTAMGLAHNSDLFAAGVDLHGVHDWNSEIPNFVPAYDSLRYGAESRTAYLASPLAAIAGWRSPVLLIHGDDDRNVPFGESVLLAYELRKRGVPVEELVFPDEIHDFLLWRDWVAAYAAAADFLNRRLVVASPVAPVSATRP
jgi:dipeptidyl aminopeptidase/acylaminoacyl peptidase